MKRRHFLAACFSPVLVLIAPWPKPVALPLPLKFRVSRVSARAGVVMREEHQDFRTLTEARASLNRVTLPPLGQFTTITIHDL